MGEKEIIENSDAHEIVKRDNLKGMEVVNIKLDNLKGIEEVVKEERIITAQAQAKKTHIRELTRSLIAASALIGWLIFQWLSLTNNNVRPVPNEVNVIITAIISFYFGVEYSQVKNS